MTILTTKRLVLRPWKAGDLESFAKLNADPRVMEYFPSVLSPVESDELGKRISSKIEEQGWGMWAASVPGVSDFIGFIGLAKVLFEAHFTPAVEIGWRLAFDHWGNGYATEGAEAALHYGVKVLDLPEIVALTAVQNRRSRRVMEKLGMHCNRQDDFEHPRVPVGNPLRKQVLYRIKKNEVTWTQ